MCHLGQVRAPYANAEVQTQCQALLQIEPPGTLIRPLYLSLWSLCKAASFDADQGRHFVRWGCMDGYVNSGNGCDLCDLPVNELSKSPIFNPTISYFGCSSCKLLSLHRGSSSYLADLRKEWFLGSENKRN